MSKKRNEKQNKKKFYVIENESIADCLNRIKQEGFQPVRRVEKPIFKETGGQTVPIGRDIIFEAIKPKHEH